MKQGLLSWSCPCPHTPSPLSIPNSPLSLKPKFLTPKLSTIITQATLNSVEESSSSSPLTGRERRKMRNERRESKSGYSWREEVEMRLIQKPKKRYASWTEELNLDNLLLLGPQWWVVRVSRVGGTETAERLARLLSRTYPHVEFKVYLPSVQIKKKLKSGTLSVKPKLLYPGCVFLRCVLGKELHDFIRECDKVGGFVGAKVGNTKRQINLPRPVDEADMEAIFKQAKEEQEKVDKAFEEEQKAKEAVNSEKGSDSPVVSKDVSQLNSTTKPRGRGRKSTKQPILEKVVGLVAGSSVQVKSGAFAGFSGTLKKINGKTGMVSVAFTLFGKETMAEIDASEIVTETNET